MYLTGLVFLGGGLGSALRFSVGLLTLRLFGSGFPFATLAVNVLGSLLMGVVAGYFAFKGEAAQAWRLFFTTGVLGGFTTFSTFSLETFLLHERGQTLLSFAYVGFSLVLSILALAAGLAVVRSLS
jgi:fluoride exporter